MLDEITDKANVALAEEQLKLREQNEDLRRSNEQKLQESADLCALLEIKHVEENELTQLIEKLKDARNQQIIVFEREEAKLEIINNQQTDAMMRLKATEETLL